MLLLRLYYEFFKAGLFAIGGGLATLPFLQEISQKTGWFSTHDLTDLIAISESTPGAIGVNAATYAGFHASGVIGGIVATLGLVTPSIIVIILISKVLQKFKSSAIVQNAFYGLRPASTGLIAAAGFSVVLATLLTVTDLPTDPLGAFNWFGIVLAVLIYLAIKKWNRHPVVYIGASALVGIVAGYLGILG
ncbi:MAG: chromate transporter [Lachnospiraceae bacterium]|nr:chromate transporter [Lachnospiraceae bacterium]